MTTTGGDWPLEAREPAGHARVRAWRPVPREVADMLCVDEGDVGGIAARIHGRFAIVLLRSPAVVRVEAGRSIVADSHWLLLVPPWQLYAVRVQGGAPDGAARGPVTLLLGPPLPAGLDAVDRPALVTDTGIGARLAALVARSQRPLRSARGAVAIRAALERLATRRVPAPLSRTRRAGAAPLAAVRDHLQGHIAEPVATAALAGLAGLTEYHLIRAFHREFGLPPHAYHLQLRLAAASELLAGGLSVSTAAYECGFADQSHLSRKFKEAYGLTPAAWATAAAETASDGSVRPERGSPAVSWDAATRGLRRTVEARPPDPHAYAVRGRGVGARLSAARPR